jgi:hypothetical protein
MDDKTGQDLRHLEDTLAGFDDEITGRYFGAALTRVGLEAKRSMVELESAGMLDLTLDGASEVAHGDEISLVGRFLNALQESLASIAQVLAGEPTSRGLIPGEIKELASLRLAETAPGSLQMKLVPAHPEVSDVSQMSLHPDVFPEDDDDERVPLLDRSVDRLIGVLAHDPEQNSDLLQDLADLGPRTATHLSELTKALNEGNANVSLAWRSDYATRSTRFTRDASKALARRLEEVTEHSRELVVTGRIVGGSLVHRRFELEPMGEEQGLLAGAVMDAALPSLELLFGQMCTATITVSEASLPSGETREAHLLHSLAQLD